MWIRGLGHYKYIACMIKIVISRQPCLCKYILQISDHGFLLYNLCFWSIGFCNYCHKLLRKQCLGFVTLLKFQLKGFCFLLPLRSLQQQPIQHKYVSELALGRINSMFYLNWKTISKSQKKWWVNVQSKVPMSFKSNRIGLVSLGWKKSLSNFVLLRNYMILDHPKPKVFEKQHGAFSCILGLYLLSRQMTWWVPS